MFSRKLFFSMAAFCILATLSFNAYASCENCTSLRDMIVFPKDPSNPTADTFLAWNFRGVAGVDYARMLTDEAYSQSVFNKDDNDLKVANYIIAPNGKVLASLPDLNPSQPYGGIFGAAGLSPNHRSSQFFEDTQQNFIYYQMDTRWSTGLVKIFKKTKYSGGRSRVVTITLSEVEGIGAKQIVAAYQDYLDKTFGTQANYKRDRSSLAISFSGISSRYKNCTHNAADFCFKLEATALVPKAPLADSFETNTDLVLGVKLAGWFSKNSVKLISAQDSSY